MFAVVDEFYVKEGICAVRAGNGAEREVEPLSSSRQPECVVTSSGEETIEIGRRIARMLPKKACILLIGNLGAGKTTLAKGIIQGLGLAEPDEVASPTYTLIHEYGEGRVYHIDLYRLDQAEQVATLGLDDIFDREAVVLIEWGERFPALMPTQRIEIQLSAIGEHERQIETKTII
jgi:tRNA threonylcarbamoyladenosine biosynthesis protein TsaE